MTRVLDKICGLNIVIFVNNIHVINILVQVDTEYNKNIYLYSVVIHYIK